MKVYRLWEENEKKIGIYSNNQGIIEYESKGRRGQQSKNVRGSELKRSELKTTNIKRVR